MIVILGGGVAGAAVAWGLSRAGRSDVVVYDPRQPGEGSTGKAMGGFRTQHGSRPNIDLALRSRDWFKTRAGRVGFQPNGYLYLAETPAAKAELAARAEFQSASGLPITHPDPASLVPFLAAADILSTNFCALDGLYLPPQVLAAFREEAAAAGATFCYGRPATPAELEDAEAVVIATGAWSKEVAKRLGVSLSVEPLERAVWKFGPFPWLDGLAVPMTLEAGSGYHFREREGGLWVTGPGDQRAGDHFRDWLWRRVPAAAGSEPGASWFGDYEVTFDHHALVGETERPGIWACCGFSGHGVMQSPAVGEGLAAMILGLTPPVDLAPLSPLRTEPLVDRTQL